jgi:hypothetical protein
MATVVLYHDFYLKNNFLINENNPSTSLLEALLIYL